MAAAESDSEKLQAIYDDWLEDDEDFYTEWEAEFLANLVDKLKETDFEFSLKQSQTIDRIYEKAYKAGRV